MKAVRQPQGLVLTLQSQRHVMALRHVERLLPLAALTALPMAPPALLGLLDLHGRPVPVLDLQVLLGGVPTPATMRTRIAVLAAACSAAADCPALALVLQGTGQVTRWPADAGGADLHAGIAAVSTDSAGSLLWLDMPALLRQHAAPLLRSAAAREPDHAAA